MKKCELNECSKHKICISGEFHISPEICKLRKEYLFTIKFLQQLRKNKKNEESEHWKTSLKS